MFSSAMPKTIVQEPIAEPRSRPQPVVLPAFPNHDLDAQYSTTRIGGDFLDVLSDDGRVVVLLTDIAGERHDTVRLAVDVQEVFRQTGRRLLRPGGNDADSIIEILQEINRALMSAAGGVRCAPTFLCVYEVKTGVLIYVNAGSAPAVLHDGAVTLLASSGVPLGLFTHLTHDAGFTVLAPNASLTLVSKGLLEARDGREEFGIGRVTQIVEHEHASAASLNQMLLRDAQKFRGARGHHGFFGPSHHIPGFRNLEDDEQDMTVFTLVRGS